MRLDVECVQGDGHGRCVGVCCRDRLLPEVSIVDGVQAL